MRPLASLVVLLITAVVLILLRSNDAHHPATDHVHHVTPVERAEMYKPTAIPDRIILTWNDDPKTTQSVNWRTSVDVTVGLAEIALAEAGPYFPEKASQVQAVSQLLKTDLSTAHYHSAYFQEPATGSDIRVSSWGW